MIELKALQGQVRKLVEDLRAQVTVGGELRSTVQAEYAAARSADRTGGTFEAWTEDVLDQAAVAWVLGCVFVRFCEDNRLVEPLWIGGTETDASAERGMQARQAYIIGHPLHNDRHWLREAFTYLAGLRATGKLVDQHNPIWRFDISGEAAEALSDFFRRGDGAKSLRSPTLDTRFLGDLYQDLSAHARATYALLQTPVFVEEFILDRTFERAVRDFGLAATSVIDPTCGSGHFLLGAFDRLLRMWKDREPATDIRELVERALGQVTGVDINPFAVAIARFRLMIAALNACGLSSLERAPHFAIRVATGDSLLMWGNDSSHQGDLLAELAGLPAFAYYTEDGDVLGDYLRPGQYTVVVGNPPYITVKDKVLNERYRAAYTACSGSYAMTVPFAQRFFSLAKRGDHDGDGAGWVGQITANSFMKREFGKKLINDYFRTQVELTEVIDTSGTYIPGFGTPTAILVGHNRSVSPRYSGTVRTILGVRGEPSQPADPYRGLVWTALVDQVDKPGSDSDWVSSVDAERDRLSTHPWSLSGGGAADLLLTIDSASGRLSVVSDVIGRTTHTGLDDAFYLSGSAVRTLGFGASVVPVVLGEQVRDYSLTFSTHTMFPYDDMGIRRPLRDSEQCFYWVLRAALERRVDFGETPMERGLRWFDHSMFFAERYRVPMSIAFAFVATHNHFVLDRGGKVFNRTAPVIKLPEGASEDDHLRLLGVLNSSTACFWLKQVSHDKGNRGGERSTARFEWEHFFEFTGTKLQEFPLPAVYPLELSREIDRLAHRVAQSAPWSIAESGIPTKESLAKAHIEWRSGRARMIGLQEHLDWDVYRLYGLLDEDLTESDTPELTLGERAFEVVMARNMQADQAGQEWFDRHGSAPITELPKHWSEEYRSVVERRIAVIESDRNIALIERPECKRRWATEGWDVMQTAALRDWLLDRLESPELWGGNPTPLSVAQVADRIRHDDDFRSVLDLWVGGDQHDLVKTLAQVGCGRACAVPAG